MESGCCKMRGFTVSIDQEAVNAHAELGSHCWHLYELLLLGRHVLEHYKLPLQCMFETNQVKSGEYQFTLSIRYLSLGVGWGRGGEWRVTWG